MLLRFRTIVMDIQTAKDNVKSAIVSYLGKDAAGNYIIPRSRQSPSCS